MVAQWEGGSKEGLYSVDGALADARQQARAWRSGSQGAAVNPFKLMEEPFLHTVWEMEFGHATGRHCAIEEHGEECERFRRRLEGERDQ